MKQVLKDLLTFAIVVTLLVLVGGFAIKIDRAHGVENQKYTTNWGDYAPEKFQTNPAYFPEVIIKALKYAQTHTYAKSKLPGELKYKNEVKTPIVHIVTAGELNKQMGCESQACYDLVTGYYDFNTRTIFLDERVFKMDSVLLEALMVHESVHYLQHTHGVPDPEGVCEVMKPLELEAWSVQRRFLHRNQRGYAIARIPSMICLEDGGIEYQI